MAFILKEAQEKASETLVKAREQFAREKVRRFFFLFLSLSLFSSLFFGEGGFF